MTASLKNQKSFLIAAARSCGFNLYRSRAIALLILRKDVTAHDLFLHAGLPRTRTYDVLTGLVRDGFIIISPKRRKPIRGRAGRVYRLAHVKVWEEWAASRERKLCLIDRHLLACIGVKKLL